jgi:plasmid maintenance system antidote protein VapI
MSFVMNAALDSTDRTRSLSGQRKEETWSVGYRIQLELKMRGWSVSKLAVEMGGSPDANRDGLTGLLFAPEQQPPLSSLIARRLAHAFGTSETLWLNIDQAWRATR